MADPTLIGFDLIIIHVDVDVASKQYSDCGTSVQTWATQYSWASLPCAQGCPPISNTVDALKSVIESWLGKGNLCNQTLLCLPAQSSGTWLAAAVLPLSNSLLVNAECNLNLESQLEQLPKD